MKTVGFRLKFFVKLKVSEKYEKIILESKVSFFIYNYQSETSIIIILRQVEIAFENEIRCMRNFR